MLHRCREQSVSARPLHAKKKTRIYKERNEEIRQAYSKKIEKIPAEALVYVDETGIDECLHRDKGRAKRGIKIYGRVTGRKYKRTNIVAALSCGQMLAPMEYEGTTDHDVFETWFEHVLLAQLPQGHVIVMDNASFHRKKILWKMASQAKCEIVFLPAYSPDLNPIEKRWANLKSFLRNYAYRFQHIQEAITDYFQVE